MFNLIIKQAKVICKKYVNNSVIHGRLGAKSKNSKTPFSVTTQPNNVVTQL